MTHEELQALYQRSHRLQAEHTVAIDCRDWARAAELRAKQIELNLELSALVRGRVLQ